MNKCWNFNSLVLEKINIHEQNNFLNYWLKGIFWFWFVVFLFVFKVEDNLPLKVLDDISEKKVRSDLVLLFYYHERKYDHLLCATVLGSPVCFFNAFFSSFLVLWRSVSFDGYMFFFQIQLFWLLTRVAVCLQDHILVAGERLLHWARTWHGNWNTCLSEYFFFNVC